MTVPSHNSERDAIRQDLFKILNLDMLLDDEAVDELVHTVRPSAEIMEENHLRVLDSNPQLETLTEYVLSQKRQVIEDLEKAGPKDQFYSDDGSMTYYHHTGRNKANAQWRTLLKQLRLKYGAAPTPDKEDA